MVNGKMNQGYISIDSGQIWKACYNDSQIFQQINDQCENGAAKKLKNPLPSISSNSWFPLHTYTFWL